MLHGWFSLSFKEAECHIYMLKTLHQYAALVLPIKLTGSWLEILSRAVHPRQSVNPGQASLSLRPRDVLCANYVWVCEWVHSNEKILVHYYSYRAWAVNSIQSLTWQQLQGLVSHAKAYEKMKTVTVSWIKLNHISWEAARCSDFALFVRPMLAEAVANVWRSWQF